MFQIFNKDELQKKEMGYFDHFHFICEFKEFLGCHRSTYFVGELNKTTEWQIKK